MNVDLRKALRATLPYAGGTGGGRGKGGISLLLRQLAHLYLGQPIPQELHPLREVPKILQDLEAKADRCERILHNDGSLTRKTLDSIRRASSELKTWYIKEAKKMSHLEAIRAKVLLGRFAVLDAVENRADNYDTDPHQLFDESREEWIERVQPSWLEDAKPKKRKSSKKR